MHRLRNLSLCLAAAALAAGALAAAGGRLPASSLRTSSAAAVLADERPAWLIAEAFRSGDAPATVPAAESDLIALDRDEARRLIEREGEGTYIHDVLASDSSLTRWPVRASEPLTYWVQSGTAHDGWSEGHRDQVDAAFATWGTSGVPLAFAPAPDSASADIVVTWRDRFDEPISGRTRWKHDRRGWIQSAQITLALRRNDGTPLEEAAVHALTLHEIGHAIGLEHTPLTGNVMAPRVRVRTLSESDRRTAQLLYRVPPGRL